MKNSDSSRGLSDPSAAHSDSVSEQLGALADAFRARQISPEELATQLAGIVAQLGGDGHSPSVIAPPAGSGDPLSWRLWSPLMGRGAGVGILDVESSRHLLSGGGLSYSTSEVSAIDLLDLADPSVDPGASSDPGTEVAAEERSGGFVSPLPSLSGSRYTIASGIGVGGQGDVFEIKDDLLCRTVALKALRMDLAKHGAIQESFLREARLTAVLGHPGVVPIYDIGQLATGAPAYTMKKISGKSLKEVLHAKREGEDWAAPYTRRRLLEILLQVAHTVGYAHHNGIVHRDLKPANIMVGEYGEVLVLDWGIARIQSSPDLQYSQEILQEVNQKHDLTSEGTVKGTPAYMAPEQASGDIHLVGPWTDVHSIGVILYEILTGEPARPPGSAEEIVHQARSPITVPPSAIRSARSLEVPPIPEDLEHLCMRCLSLQPHQRYLDGEDVARAISACLDGQTRRDLAEKRAEESEYKAEQLRRLTEECLALTETVIAGRAALDPWADLAEKRPLWEKEEFLRAKDQRREELLQGVIHGYTLALDGDPDNKRARSALAQLYFEQLTTAERLGRMNEVRQLTAQIRRLDDETYASMLTGTGSLSLTSDPPHQDVYLSLLVSRDRMLQPSDPRHLGKTPIMVTGLPTGRYLCVLRSRGGRETLYPVLISRQTEWKGHLVVYPHQDDAYVYIPAGPFIFGGDRQANNAGPREQRSVRDFAIARYPVTCKEYAAFLQSIAATEARRYFPRSPRDHGDKAWWTFSDGRISIPRVDDAGGRWDPRFPVRCVSRTDALAFAEWKSAQDSRSYRLPSEDEWEKAGRGVDGRFFPWGDAFDATFCKMRNSRPGRVEPEGVGAFPTDRSPYGVHDMAGSISEWCSDDLDKYGLMGVAKGGYWRGGESTCRLARRFASDPEEPGPYTGIRLVKDF